MRLHRIFIKDTLVVGQKYQLPKQAVHHLVNVLRIKTGQQLCLFNGDGHNYSANIVCMDKRNIQIQIETKSPNNVESPLHIVVVQTISRGDKMDFTLQKSVELGVKEIYPITSERCGVKLISEREDKKLVHWQQVIISACEQSGRSFIPILHPVTDFQEYIENRPTQSECLLLSPYANQRISNIQVDHAKPIHVLIGPEGGFSETEQNLADNMPNSTLITMGKRILRTETAALAAISAIQTMHGDF